MKEAAGAAPKRVLIVDDHPMICQGLTRLIDGEEGLAACGTADDANAAIRLVAERAPDAVIVDISLKSSSGLDFIRALASRHPAVRALVYSMHDESVYAERALRAGAKGYVMKDQPPEVLLGALRKILDGNVYFSDAIVARLIGRMADRGAVGTGRPEDALTDRELEIFTLVGRELKSAQIAKKLNISVKTVEAHREHIRKKLDLHDSSELKKYATEWVNRNVKE